jgi:hypothetical protein
MALPNLIIAGAPKCGTSSLFQWIADHPDAEGSFVKETCFFTDAESHVFDPTNNFSAAGLAGYERFFPVSKPKALIRLEATPTYIYQNSAFQHLPGIKTRPRFLFVLREPSQQILSTYRYFKNNWTFLKGSDGFADFIEMASNNNSRLNRNELLRDALTNVRYVEHLERWRDRLGTKRMHVMILEDLQNDPARAMADLAGWLGLDPAFYEDYGFPRENETYRVKSRLLQEINIGVRGLAARTPLYGPVRALYRRLNTAKQPEAITVLDEAALANLQSAYASDNDRLAREFNLDLERWQPRGATSEETPSCP